MALREVVEAYCLRKLGRKPDLDSPKTFNDLVNWLKLYDQTPEHITCCDKWAVRDWVAARAGPEVLIPATLGWPPRRLPVIAKCTHDSGSAREITRLHDRAVDTLHHRLQEKYGADKGEWAYDLVPPQIICEQPLPPPIVDYKFHCSHGKVRCCLVVSERDRVRPKSTVFSADGWRLDRRIDVKLIHAPNADVFPGHRAWCSLVELAEKLAVGWRYVRVDLYWSEGKALFGEMTFWPAAGCGMGPDHDWLGAILELDLSYKHPPIVC